MEARNNAVSVPLSEPITINGVTVDTLVMRRPKLKDVRAAQMVGKDEEEWELRLFAILLDCAPSELEELDFADYRKLQATFQGMVEK